MGWSLGYDDNWKRDIGYGVPSTCDHPSCNEEINRGLAHVCGGQPPGGEFGCGLFFCAKAPAADPRPAQQCAGMRLLPLELGSLSPPVLQAHARYAGVNPPQGH